MNYFQDNDSDENNFQGSSKPCLFSSQFDQHQQIDEKPKILTEKQQTQMLYAIDLKDNQNLLDISYTQEQTLVEKLQYKQFIQNRIVHIHDPTTIHDGYFLTYKLYKIKTKKKGSDCYDSTVERRYSDFEYLHDQLLQNFGGCVIPCLPQKNLWASFDMETLQDRNKRKRMLCKYLNLLIQHKKISYSIQLKSFLFDDEKLFSSKKGQFTARNKLQDKVIKFSGQLLEYGKYLAGQYLSQVPQTKKVSPKSKQYTQILHYDILLQDLTKLLNKIQIIVENTSQESVIMIEMENNFDFFIKQKQSDMKSDNESQTQEITIEKQKYKSIHELTDKYQEIVQFVRSCKLAIQRWSHIYLQLQNLKNIQKQLLQGYNNPRNLRLDVVRSKISDKSKKISLWTKDLLQQLDTNINLGKSQINKFIIQLQQQRYKNYSTGLHIQHL